MTIQLSSWVDRSGRESPAAYAAGGRQRAQAGRLARARSGVYDTLAKLAAMQLALRDVASADRGTTGRWGRKEDEQRTLGDGEGK